MEIGVKFFVLVGVGFFEEVGEAFFVFWLGGGLLFRVGNDLFGGWRADAIACVLLDGFDDGEDALFGFGHGVGGTSKERSQYAILSVGGASHLVRRAFGSLSLRSRLALLRGGKDGRT